MRACESQSHSLLCSLFHCIFYRPYCYARSLEFTAVPFYPTPSLITKTTFTMRTALSAVVALASTLQVASAGWTDASAFSCPSNTNNHCSSQQSGGFDWGSLNLGSFSEYGGFSFEGFSCASSFGGSAKRDALTGRSFQVCHTPKHGGQ